MTTFRESCGSPLGMRLHQEAGEEFCGECQSGEAWRLLARELIPTRPTPPPSKTVITKQQAEAHAWELMLANRAAS
jgi:hypothetical protein